ncbi:MAG: ArnT family glycosyltransferase [Candidatus Hodarchaeota archaeon]
MYRRLEYLFLITLVTVYFVWFAWPLVWTASENIRIVSVFNADEAHHLQMIRDAIINRNPRLEFGNYGHLYFNIALLPLFLTAYVTQISEQHIIIVLRLVPCVFAIATIIATFVLTRRYLGRFAAWLAATLLAIVPLKFLELSVVSHPDVPQLFFLLLGVYFCCRFVEQEDFRWLIWSSACAGLAFATKYGGVFLLPIIWILLVVKIIRNDSRQLETNTARFALAARVVIGAGGIICVIIGTIITSEFVGSYLAADGRIDDALKIQFLHSARVIVIFIGCTLLILAIPRFIWRTIEQRPKIATSLKRVFLFLGTFGLAFFLASPFSFYRLNFLKGIYFEARHTAFGHWFEASSIGLMWFPTLLSPQLLDIFILGLAAISLILTVYETARNRWKRPILSPEFVMWAWIFFNMSFLILRVNMPSLTYLLPVIPFLIILSTLPLSRAVEYSASRLSRKRMTVLVIAIIFIIGGVELPRSLGGLYKYRQSIISREETSVSVKAGKWLSENYPASTRILYDYYSYVPSSFLDAHATWGGTMKALERLTPEIVVVNKSISNRFSDIHHATKYADGENEFVEKHEYYKAMREERVGYRLIRDFGAIRVYARSSAQPIDIVVNRGR